MRLSEMQSAYTKIYWAVFLQLFYINIFLVDFLKILYVMKMKYS